MEKEKYEGTETIRLKIRFYVMSLWLLFVLIFLLTIDIPIYFGEDARFIGFIPLLSRNILPVVSIILAALGLLGVRKTEYEWKGVTNPPYRIKTVRNENYEYLTFLTTYIIPLICIDLENIRYVIVLGVLLVLIGFIFVKMDLYYGNPTLALLGYHLYRVDVEEEDAIDGIVLLSKDKLQSNDDVEWIRIGEYVWVAKKCKRLQ